MKSFYKKFNIFLIFLIILILVVLNFSCNNKLNTIKVDDTIEVYSTIIEKFNSSYSKRFHGENISIVINQISLGRGGHVKDTSFPCGNDINTEFLYIKSRMKSLKKETFYDFVNRNGVNDTIINKFAASTNNSDVLFLSDSLVKEIFIHLSGWEEFYKRYPKSHGILSFSIVGFDSSKNQAFLTISRMSDWTDGVGEYLLLEKKGTRWEIISSVSLWIS